MPRFKGSGNLLESLQSDYDEQQSADFKERNASIREQGLGIREAKLQLDAQGQEQTAAQRAADLGLKEEHFQQVQELAQKAAEVHDQQVSVQIASQQLEMEKKQAMLDRQKTQFIQEQGAWGELRKLNPQSADYRDKFGEIGQKYPAAFARAQGDQESGLAQFASSMNQEHEAWALKTQIKEQTPQVIPADVAINYAKYIGTQHEQTAILGKPEATDQEKADAQGKIVAAKSFQSEMERLYPALKPATPGAPVTTAAPAQPIDMDALARQALSDPTASPEHKAAAQKRLSGQQ